MAILTQALLVHLYLSLILSSFILQPWKNDRDCGEKKKKLTALNPEPWHVFLSIRLNILPPGLRIRTTESIAWAELFLIVMRKKDRERMCEAKRRGRKCDTVPGALSKLSGCVESPRAARSDDSVPLQPVTCSLACLPFSGWVWSVCVLHLES